jgi:DNA repair exonuclease SbcCD ATPase subunit
MYISQVKLRNIKGFHGTREVDLELTAPGWTVIAGRNGSGKTTLLRAMALAVVGPRVASNLVPDFENWITTGCQAGLTSVGLTTDTSVDLTAGPHSDVPVRIAVPRAPAPVRWKLG